MPGLGRRTFAPGEVLTATNVMGYLQDQAVMTFAGTAARGSAIGTAVSQGMVSFVGNTGNIEAYYGTYGTANLGGRTPAGWYAATNTDALVPMRPSSVTAVGSGSSASIDPVGVVTFSTVTSLQLADVFTSAYKSYKVIIEGVKGTSSTSGLTFLRVGNAGVFALVGYQGGLNGFESGFGAITAIPDNSALLLTNLGTTGKKFISEVTISDPAAATQTSFVQQSLGYSAGNANLYSFGGTLLDNTTAYSSLSIAIGAGTISGTIRVLGFNR